MITPTKQQLIIGAVITVTVFLNIWIGSLIPYPKQDPPPTPSPRGFVISYQAGITNNMTRIGNIVVPGPVFTEVLLNQSLQHIQSDTNVTKGSVTILNAFPIY